MLIQKTQDYSMFNTIKGNRSLVKKHANKLKETIKEENLLSFNPIIVNEKLEVIDGQHRLWAAQELGLPIYYITMDEGQLGQVQMINENLKPWANQDFLNSFIAVGKSEYVALKQFITEHNISIGIALMIISKTTNSDDIYQVTRNFRQGKFVFSDREGAERFAKNLIKISHYVDHKFWGSRNFIRALQIAFEKVSPEEFVERVTQSSEKLRERPNVREYLRDFEEVYNWRQRKSITRFLLTKKEATVEKKK